MEENTKGMLKTKAVRGYYRSDKQIQLFQDRYEAKKRLNGFFQQEQQIELDRIEEQIAIEYSDDLERALDTTGKQVYYNGERIR